MTRSMWASLLRVGIVSLVAVVAASTSAVAKDQSRIRGDLENIGAIPAATGTARSVIRPVRSRVKIRLRNLSPSTSYAMLVGGVAQATFTTNAAGAGRVRFDTRPRGTVLPLDFDPRGKTFVVSDGVNDVLQMVHSGAGEPAGIAVDERTDLAPTAIAASGKAEARFRIRRDGRTTFKVEIEDVPPGDYDLFVDGILRGTITVNAGLEGEIEFDSEPSPPKLLLDFDPRGATIDVVQGSDVFFSGPMRADGNGITTCSFSEVERPVASTGIDPDGHAKARLRVRQDCDRDFRVEIEDVDVGAYELLVGGIVRGTIDVADTGTETEGEIEFDTDPDEPGELLLDFDPTNATIDVRQGATVFFSDGFDPGTGGPSSCVAEETIEVLASTGADPDGSGEARHRVRDDCEQDFRVEIEDLPPGDYDLFVGGVLRATIAVADLLGSVQGEIEFDTDPDEPGKLLLDFDPRGALIEIVQASTTFFSHVLGGGSSGPVVCEPLETEVPLLNVGPQPSAKGKARFRQKDDCDLDFRVEIEDLPLGDYDLHVDGISRGTITVALVGGEAEGQIEFDTDPDQPGELPLAFDPRGLLIDVEQGGTVLLSRIFPAE